MRVLMPLRPDWRRLPGGDLVFQQRWAAWLRHLGVQVLITTEREPDLRGVDLVHFFNVGRAHAYWATLEHVRRHDVPRVLTPFYWPVEEYERQGRPGFLGLLGYVLPGELRDRFKTAARCLLASDGSRALLKQLWTGSRVQLRRFLRAFDAILPNSQAEAQELARLIPDHRIEAHHGAVDSFYWSQDQELWHVDMTPILPGVGAQPPFPRRSDKEQPRDGVLCVARFDPQKAQHRLIRALKPLGVRLTLAGPDNPNYPGYRAYCQRLADSGVTILPRQDPAALWRLYRKCQVHALASWYETTGLTGLEAGCGGARVVMTERGGGRDYAGDLAWYADPANLYSIGRTVEKALQAANTPDLRHRVERHFSWPASTRRLLGIYESVLAMNRGQRQAA